MDVEQYKYIKNQVLSNLETLKEKHKEAYSVLKVIHNITENSDDIPLSMLYTTLSHTQSDTAKVANDINALIQELLPKKESKSQEKNEESSEESKEPKKPVKKESEKDYNKPLDDEDDFDLDSDDDLE